jgi:signal transduction histidine kinase
MLRSPWSPAALTLVLLMAIGSVIMWIGVPLGLIYLASLLAGSSRPSVGPYLLVLLGLPVGMAIVGKCLGALDRLHSRLTGRQEERHRATWLRSMRAERASSRRGGILDKVMIVSVALALIAFAVWFFGFAGSSLPTA